LFTKQKETVDWLDNLHPYTKKLHAKEMECEIPCKLTSTPAEVEFGSSTFSHSIEPLNQAKYQSDVGSFMFQT